jgi:two-component system chemotaxis response regulator CheB
MTEIALIAIGGSAGVLDALLAILPALPDALTTPIVIVVHLSPGQPSLLPELLGRACRRAVIEIEDKQAMQQRTIHVAPPNYHVLCERDRTLALSVDPPVQFSRPSIDVLFESAADAFGSAVVGVLLSGSNDDGARGLARIERAGGIAVIQDPASAAHPEMPAAAVRWIGSAARLAPLDGLASLLAEAITLHQDDGR